MYTYPRPLALAYGSPLSRGRRWCVMRRPQLPLRRPAPQHHVSLEQEFLRTLAGIDLGGEDVALGVEREIVNPVEVAGHAAVAAEAADGFAGLARQRADLVIGAVGVDQEAFV